MTTTLLTMRQRLRAAMSDGVREAVTTALAANTSVISTNLNKWDDGRDDFFNDWYCYIEDENNAGQNRVISDYATSGGTCTVRGANFTSDGANLATAMFTKCNPDNSKLAIQRAIRAQYPTLYKYIDSQELITGNILPNSHFTDWAATTYPDFYRVSNAAAVETTTARQCWGGTASAKVTCNAADGYMYLSSDQYPRLLDLMGKTVTFKAWAYPEVADDAWIQIYTLQADGTAQTLPATHAAADVTCPADYYTLLELEDQTLNDDLVQVQFRFRVHTKDKYAYFDNARGTGLNIREYILPTDFKDGNVSQVWIQTSGEADDPCDDLHIRTQEKIVPLPNIYSDGTYKYIRLPAAYGDEYKIHLMGYKPLTVPTTDAGTTEVDDPALQLLIAQAALELNKIQQGLVSTKDKGKFDAEIARWDWEVGKLTPRHRMARPSQTLRFPL